VGEKKIPPHTQIGVGAPTGKGSFTHYTGFLWKSGASGLRGENTSAFVLVYLCMRWLTVQEVREVLREFLGWDVHPNTLRTWARTGKIRSVISPGRGRTFYPIEEVAKVLGLEPSQVAAIVQKEKGGRP
jgi:hypothetical protein